MSNIFSAMAEKSGHEDSSKYGMSGDMKKTQYILELIGKPTDADTLKCIITAAEQGMEMNCYSMITDAVDNMETSIKEISPFSVTPCLQEADFITNGSDAITAFTDARGLGYALTPRNAALAAMQNYWVDIAETNVAPHVNMMVEEAISKKTQDSSYTPDAAVIGKCVDDLKMFFDALDQQLASNKYIVCDKYTWADLHWTAYAHLCVVAGYGSIIDDRKNVKAWLDRIKSRKSQCGQDIVAYDMLPSAEETLQGKLKDVVIDNY